ncbi:MAG: hypothetical protein NVS3B2_09770 [Ramlibacter sp.]
MPDSVADKLKDHRCCERFDTALAVDVEGLTARTRNISATGIYFETEVELPLGTVLNLQVQFTHGGVKHWLPCEGEVVRVTREQHHRVVAARLRTPFFAPPEASPRAAGASG